MPEASSIITRLIYLLFECIWMAYSLENQHFRFGVPHKKNTREITHMCESEIWTENRKTICFDGLFKA